MNVRRIKKYFFLKDIYMVFTVLLTASIRKQWNKKTTLSQYLLVFYVVTKQLVY